VLSLGESPLANNLKNIDDLKDVDTYPLELNYCLDCHNCQLSVVVPPEKMFDEYLYLSSTSQSFVKHFEEAAEKYVKRFKLDENSTVIDIGSNDGIALKPFQKKGIKVLGIEPATNIAKIANEQGTPTYNSYFNDRAISDIFNKTGLVDIVTASNVFAHSDNLAEMLYSAFMLLKEDGTFIVEVQYLLSTMQDLTFDNIYHEHVNYWSVTSLSKFCDIFHLKLYDVEFIDTHGGSIRAYIKRKYDHTENALYGEQAISKSVRDFIAREEQFGLTKLETYKQFGDHINYLKDKVRKNMDSLKDTYFLIAGYGSPAKATTALNFFGINYKDISYTIEDNELKNNKYIPGVNIPIKNKEYAHSNLPDLIIVLAWNFYDTIVANNQDLVDKGIKFISIKDLLS
jgi:2-polyprenyl-3-methyl-5-hydroxy-6-metoxy-1,4-benzoquinol methylase